MNLPSGFLFLHFWRKLIEVFKNILGWHAFNCSAQVAIIWRKVADCINMRVFI